MKKEIKPSLNNNQDQDLTTPLEAEVNQDQSRPSTKGMTVVLSLTIIIVVIAAILVLGKKPEPGVSSESMPSEKANPAPIFTPTESELIENFSPLPQPIVSTAPVITTTDAWQWGNINMEFDGYVFTTTNFNTTGNIVKVLASRFSDSIQGEVKKMLSPLLISPLFMYPAMLIFLLLMATYLLT